LGDQNSKEEDQNTHKIQRIFSNGPIHATVENPAPKKTGVPRRVLVVLLINNVKMGTINLFVLHFLL
jgi:hypothetical protein